ncbi:MAG: hypothetical protein AAGJ83_15985, partial [Planctomycetota bacterium]
MGMIRTTLCVLAVSHWASFAHATDRTPPKIFLDKSPRIVKYQLKRLEDERLLLVERDTTDAKFIPVFEAIVSRPGISAEIRQKSLQALAELRASSVSAEILQALRSIDRKSEDSARLQALLTRQLLGQPTKSLRKVADQLVAVASGDDVAIRPVGFAGLVAIDDQAAAASLAKQDGELGVAFLNGVQLHKSGELRDRSLSLTEQLFNTYAENADRDGIRAAIDALSRIPSARKEAASLLLGYLSSDEHRVDAARGLLRLPVGALPAEKMSGVAAQLTAFAETT